MEIPKEQDRGLESRGTNDRGERAIEESVDRMGKFHVGDGELSEAAFCPARVYAHLGEEQGSGETCTSWDSGTAALTRVRRGDGVY